MCVAYGVVLGLTWKYAGVGFIAGKRLLVLEALKKN